MGNRALTTLTLMLALLAHVALRASALLPARHDRAARHGYERVSAHTQHLSAPRARDSVASWGQSRMVWDRLLLLHRHVHTRLR